MAKTERPKTAAELTGRLGPPPQTILRGGTHADKRRKSRNNERLAIREALDAR